MPELMLCLSAAGPAYEAALNDLDRKYSKHRRGVMLYEQFVCTPPEPQSPERILGFDGARCEATIKTLRARLRDEDLLIRNTEDGHPYYGERYQLALERLHSYAATEGKTASYGLIKTCRYPSTGMAPHAKAPFSSPVRELDAAAATIIDFDDAVIVEIYLAHVSAGNGAQISDGMMREMDQRRWIRHDLTRGLLLAEGKPVHALVHPVYVGRADRVAGRILTPSDRRLVLQECRDMGIAGVGLWMHLGMGYTSIDLAKASTLAWTSEGKAWGFGATA